MLTIARYSSGRRVDGLVLAAGADRMRIVFHGGNETTELTRIGDRWVTERGGLLEIEALIPVRHVSAETYTMDSVSNSENWRSGLVRTATAMA